MGDSMDWGSEKTLHAFLSPQANMDIVFESSGLIFVKFYGILIFSGILVIMAGAIRKVSIYGHF